MTQINADDDEFKGVTALRWLKRQLKGRITTGVKGTNEELEAGGHYYHDISYTPAAAELYASGVVLKPSTTNRAVFVPVKAT